MRGGGEKNEGVVTFMLLGRGGGYVTFSRKEGEASTSLNQKGSYHDICHHEMS